MTSQDPDREPKIVRAQKRARVRERNELLADMWKQVNAHARWIVLPDEHVAAAKALGYNWVVSAAEAKKFKYAQVPIDVMGFHLDALVLHHAEPVDWDLSRFTWLYDESQDRLRCRDSITGRTEP